MDIYSANTQSKTSAMYKDNNKSNTSIKNPLLFYSQHNTQQNTKGVFCIMSL